MRTRRAASSTGTASGSRRPRRGAPSIRDERRAGPVVEVARACCPAPADRRRGRRSAPATAARAAPTRAADRRATRAISASAALGVGRRARAPRSRRPGRTRRRRTAALDRHRLETRGSAAARVAHSASSLGSSRSIPTTRPIAEAPRPVLGEHALAAADVEHRLRRGRANSSSSVRSKPAISRRTTGLVEPYLSNVLPVGTSGADGAQLGAALIPRAPRDRRPAGSAPAARGAPGLVVRRLDPSWSSIRRTRSNVRCDSVRCAASRSPITPSAPSSIAALNSTAPSDQRLDVAGACRGSLDESRSGSGRTAPAPATPMTSAPPQNTLSGSYWE